MELEIEVKKLVAHIESCSLQIPPRNPPHEHVSSIIADAVLQVGHRWKTHVGPRLERMRATYPNTDTISGVSDLLETDGAQNLLNWKGKDAQERFSQSIHFFKKERVETFDDLREWLKSDNNRDRLITKSSRSNKAGIPKIANATADYYRVLVGLPDAVKVDTLVQKFLVEAGIVKKHTYEEKRNIVQLAAKQLEKRPIDLDGAIWNYEEKTGKEKDEMEQDERLSIPLSKDKIEQLEKLAQREFGINGADLARFWIIDKMLYLSTTQTLSPSAKLDSHFSDQPSVTQKVASLITVGTPVKKPEESKCLITVKITQKQLVKIHHPVIPKKDRLFFPPSGQEFKLELSTGENIYALMSTSPTMHGHMHSKLRGKIQAWWVQVQPKVGNTLVFEEVVPKTQYKVTII